MPDRGLPKAFGLCLLITAALFAPTSAEADPFTITITGTIQSSSGPTDTALLFGAAINTLVGTSYTETITTDPTLDSIRTSTATNNTAYGGGSFGSAAPYTITTTVNGVTYSQTESNPFWNRTYLQSVSQPNFMDQIVQEVQSNGCVVAYGLCVESFINAYSLATPFLSSLDFDQILTVPGSKLDPGSNVLFSYRNGPTTSGSVDQFTEFTGSITSVKVNHVPEPSSLVLLLTSIVAGLGVKQRVWKRARSFAGSTD